jgi:hypothetical protein
MCFSFSYKERFLAALPPSRRASTDFGRPVFTAAAFYLCAKRHKLKVDKLKLIDLCGTSSSEFTTVSTSMADLCFDVFGIAKEKKDAKSIKGSRGICVLQDPSFFSLISQHPFFIYRIDYSFQNCTHDN